MGVPAVLAFVITFCVLQLILRRFARFALDEPNARSLHEQPIPRTGGIGVVLGFCVALAAGAATLWPLAAAALGLALVSLADDVRGVPAALRLAAHVLAAAVALWFMGIPLGPLGVALLGVAIIWVTNLYNFMDGADGLAGGMALIGFGTYAIAAALAGHQPLAALSGALAAAAAAFLLHNFPPARLFLGDVGSVPLGFLAAVLGLEGWREGAWPLWFPLLVFGVFNADATVTLIRRALRRERPWQAHREHYYQRMVRMGLGHRGMVLAVYALMLTCCAAALFARTQALPVQLAAFGLATLVLACAATWVDWRWTRFQQTAS